MNERGGTAGRRKTRCLFGFALLTVMTLTPAQAAEIEGIQFADRAQAGTAALSLKGVGLARYLFFKMYVTALYMADGIPADKVLADVPKRLELSYFQNIKAGDFATAADQVLMDNIPASTVASLRSKIDRLHQMYRDITPGDRYTLTYVPGTGTELALNGKPLGTVEGADFAAAYFAIWLGPKPISESLKSQLLNKP
jgi:Chalcone isomerase-like